MKYLLAVSGGIDSVVLLDILAQRDGHNLIVAHFDHGIRPDSADDARFVEGLARKYHLPYVAKREVLGVNASEALARNRRYAFLRTEAKKYEASLVTAHHNDDVVETIAINLLRGTGWRGVAVLDAVDIARPLFRLSKDEIRAYARDHRLEWVEDSTNSSTDYLRNRVRQRITRELPLEQKEKIREVWQRQLVLKNQIDQEIQKYIQDDNEYSRYFFIQIDSIVACELLRAAIVAVAQASPTRPQIERALLAIKTAKAYSTFELGAGVVLYFTTHTFIVQTP